MQITTIQELRQFADEMRIIGRHTMMPLVFGLDTLSSEENAVLQAEANRLLAACGCGTGATFCIVSVVLYALAVFFAGPTGPGAWAMIVLGGFATVLLAGSVGKMIGIAHARLRLRRIVGRMLSELEKSASAQAITE